MDAAAESGRNFARKHQVYIALSVRMSQLADAGRDDRTSVSRDQILRREREQGNFHLPCSADDHEQDWQPYYTVNSYSAIL